MCDYLPPGSENTFHHTVYEQDPEKNWSFQIMYNAEEYCNFSVSHLDV